MVCLPSLNLVFNFGLVNRDIIFNVCILYLMRKVMLRLLIKIQYVHIYEMGNFSQSEKGKYYLRWPNFNKNAVNHA